VLERISESRDRLFDAALDNADDDDAAEIEKRLDDLEQRATDLATSIALLGDTNAGKSTLMRALTRDTDVFVQDQLFATLDPLTRRVYLDDTHPALITDTVGFIQKLPTQLVAAFRATLEELTDATVLLHVVDITHPDAAHQSQTVEDTLRDLHLADKPRITVLNKVDELPDADGHKVQSLDELRPFQSSLTANIPDAVLVSAEKRWGLDALKQRVVSALDRAAVPG